MAEEGYTIRLDQRATQPPFRIMDFATLGPEEGGGIIIWQFQPASQPPTYLQNIYNSIFEEEILHKLYDLGY